MASADFTVNGATCPPEASVAYGETVTLAALSNSFNTSEWRIVGTDRPETAIPTIVPGGSPLGETATFVVGVDPGDGLGISYLLERKVNGGVNAAGQYDSDLVKRALIGVGNTNGLIPAAVGEKFERSATHGWTEVLNQALGAAGGGGGGGFTVGGTPATTKYVGWSGVAPIWLTIAPDGTTLQSTSGTWSVKAGGLDNSHLAAGANIALTKLAQSGATTGQYLAWSGTAWAPANGVASFNGRINTVTPASGDYTSTQVTNSSTVTGSTVTAALDTLKSSITSLVTGVSSFNSRSGAVVPASGDYNSTQLTNSSTVSGSTVTAALDNLKAIVGARFGATFYIDPAFVGTSNGTESNPYTTVTAAIAASPASGALFKLAPYSTLTENITFPTAGLWEIQSEGEMTPTINGNLVVSGSGGGVVTLTNLIINGTVSGSSSGTRYFITINTDTNGAVNLTSSGGSWLLLADGLGDPHGPHNGKFGSSVAVAGALQATCYYFAGSITSTSASVINTCELVSGSVATTGSLLVQGTTFHVASTFTGASAITIDGYSHASALNAGGITLAGGAMLTIRNSVALDGIQQGGATSGQALVWSGSAWAPSSVVSGVSSVFSRTGAVVAAAGDYTSTQITNSSSVTSGGANVTTALNSLQSQVSSISGSAGVSSFNTRTGAVSPASGDYTSTLVTNSSTVTGSTVTAALDTLKAASGVSSFKTRTGAVVPAANDYAASQIGNDALVAGSTVALALEGLSADDKIEYKGFRSVSGSVTLVLLDAGKALRVGAATTITIPTNASVAFQSGTRIVVFMDVSASLTFTAASGVTLTTPVPLSNRINAAYELTYIGSDVWRLEERVYDDSQIINASTVTGSTTKDALNTLKAADTSLAATVAGLVTGVSSVFGRTNAVVAAAGDYTSSLITNSSGVTGSTVTAALDLLSRQTYRGVSGHTGSYTLVAADAHKFITLDASTTITVSNGVFAAGDEIDFIITGGTTHTFVQGSGVSILGPIGSTLADVVYAVYKLRFIGNAGGTDFFSLTQELGNRPFAGDISLPLCPMPTGDVLAGNWALHNNGSGTADYWWSGTTAFDISFPIGGLSTAQTITRIRARIYPQVGTLLPTSAPTLKVYQTDDTHHSPATLIGTATDSTTGSHGTYETPHDLDITGLSVTLGSGNLTATIRSAAGTNLGQTKLISLIVTVA